MTILKLLIVLGFCFLSQLVLAESSPTKPENAIKEDITPPPAEGPLTIDQVPALINTKPEAQQNLIPPL